MELHSPNQSKEDDKKLGFSVGDEGPDRSTITSTEFYCLDGGFASHLPTNYKVPCYINAPITPNQIITKFQEWV